jgi:branched-chain amino acid transport system permease protein
MSDFMAQHDAVIQITVVNVMLACSLYLPLRMGQFQVAPAAFMAVGGYTTAVVTTKYEWGPVLTVVLSVAAAGIFGAVVGSVLLWRLEGVYLALGSFVVVELVRVIALHTEALGGSLGMYGIPMDLSTNMGIVAALAVVGLLGLLQASRFGLAMNAVRDDRLAASGIGLRVRRVEIYVFALSSAIAGLAGCFRAEYFFSVGASDYGLNRVLEMLTFVIVGGMGGVLGPLLGAVGLTFLMEPLAEFAQWRTFVQGAILLATIIFLPGGLYSLGEKGRRLYRWVRRRPDPSSGDSAQASEPDERVPEDAGARG